MLLNYQLDPPAVQSLSVVPRQFLVSSVIEQRKALRFGAQRAGWIGCNIVLSEIPTAGRIAIYSVDGFRQRDDVVVCWQQTSFIRADKQASWLVDTMRGIESLNKAAFSLADAYSLEARLSLRYPDNHNIRAKIRQQLQKLRDAGYLDFLGGGTYKIVERERGGLRFGGRGDDGLV